MLEKDLKPHYFSVITEIVGWYTPENNIEAVMDESEEEDDEDFDAMSSASESDKDNSSSDEKSSGGSSDEFEAE